MKNAALSKHIGQNLKSARLKAKLTQEGAAKRLGLVRTSLANMEGGGQDFTVSMLHRIAKVYDTTITRLVSERTYGGK